ncbi:hypothetical protein ABD07_03310 [Nitrosomonas oligotropha]|nr:hypothetical protein [Nitrosomonas oligotropha]
MVIFESLGVLIPRLFYCECAKKQRKNRPKTAKIKFFPQSVRKCKKRGTFLKTGKKAGKFQNVKI